MRAYYILLISVGILVAIGILFAHSQPSSEDLDKDIAEVQAAIQKAEIDAAQYSSGLILSQIALRKSTLQLTEAMLLKKRKAVLRRVNLNYTIEGEKIVPASTDQLANIQKDIETVKAGILKIEREAAQYRGGLILATLLMNAETQKMTLASLEHKYYTAKYGIPFITTEFRSEEDQKEPVGEVVEDKDAL